MGFQRQLSILNFIVPPVADHLPIIAVLQAHFSNIPTFHLSNWGEAPNLNYNHGRSEMQEWQAGSGLQHC